MANKIYHLKVVPNSEAEDYFIEELMHHVVLPKGSVTVRLGAMWGVNYNEYIMTAEAYQIFKNYIKVKKSKEP